MLDSSGRTLLERPGEERYEWQIPPGAWSPDGRFLLLLRNDARRVHTIPIVDYTQAIEQVTMTPYSKVGTPLVRTEPYVAMRMAAALIHAGKRFDLLVMPGEPHTPEEPAFRYYLDDVRRFFVDKLGAPR